MSHLLPSKCSINPTTKYQISKRGIDIWLHAEKLLLLQNPKCPYLKEQSGLSWPYRSKAVFHVLMEATCHLSPSIDTNVLSKDGNKGQSSHRISLYCWPCRQVKEDDWSNRSINNNKSTFITMSRIVISSTNHRILLNCWPPFSSVSRQINQSINQSLIETRITS